MRLETRSKARLESTLQAGCWWWKDGLAYVHVPLAPAAPSSGTTYTAHARNSTKGYSLALEIEVRRD